MTVDCNLLSVDLKNMKDLVFATHNAHKLEELRAILKEFNILGLHDINCHEEIVEDGETLYDNAIIKANYVTENYHIDCFADDTGLEVDALDGAPGVYSARYAGEGCSYQDNVNKLLQAMEGVENRKARFKTVIALNLNGEQYTFEGKVEGVITKEQHGEKGFGYDPIFRPDGFEETFAEMSMEVKNRISHRGRATQKLVEFLLNNN